MLTVCALKLDALNFNQAFNIARNEVGATGIFFWQGEPYHTLLAEERASLSPEEWNDYGQMIRETLASIDWAVPETIPDPEVWMDMQIDPPVLPSFEPDFTNLSTPAVEEISASEWSEFFSSIFE